MISRDIPPTSRIVSGRLNAIAKYLENVFGLLKQWSPRDFVSQGREGGEFCEHRDSVSVPESSYSTAIVCGRSIGPRIITHSTGMRENCSVGVLRCGRITCTRISCVCYRKSAAPTTLILPNNSRLGPRTPATRNVTRNLHHSRNLQMDLIAANDQTRVFR